MTAKDKMAKAVQLLNEAGIQTRAYDFTIGGGVVKFKVFQGRKEREAEITFKTDGKVSGSKYVYLLPNNLDRTIAIL